MGGGVLTAVHGQAGHLMPIQQHGDAGMVSDSVPGLAVMASSLQGDHQLLHLLVCHDYIPIPILLIPRRGAGDSWRLGWNLLPYRSMLNASLTLS